MLDISPREVSIYNQGISDKGFAETNTSRSDPQEIGVLDASRKVNIDPLPRESVRVGQSSAPDFCVKYFPPGSIDL